METKICSRCGELKPVGKFYKDRAKCKDCINKYRKEYRKQNADKIKEYSKEYMKEYRKKNADKKKEYMKEYRKKNADKKKEYMKEYYKQNADKIRKYDKEYQKQNVIVINGTQIHINTAPEEIKPTIKKLIKIKNLKTELRKNKKLLLGENNG